MCAVIVELQVLGVASSCSTMLIYYAHFGSRSFEQVGTAHDPRFFFPTLHPNRRFRRKSQGTGAKYEGRQIITEL